MRTIFQSKASGTCSLAKRAAMLLMLLFAGSGMAMAQGFTVSGRVTDTEGGVLPELPLL